MPPVRPLKRQDSFIFTYKFYTLIFLDGPSQSQVNSEDSKMNTVKLVVIYLGVEDTNCADKWFEQKMRENFV